MAFFDSTLSEAQIAQALKMNAQGACDIKVEEENKENEISVFNYDPKFNPDEHEQVNQ